MTKKIDINKLEKFFLNIQNKICTNLETQEPNQNKFIADKWNKNKTGKLQGYGISKTLSSKDTFEKAGVNFSFVHGKKLPISATSLKKDIGNYSFTATGVSLVIHPNNPFVPISHANFRIFVTKNNSGDDIWWAGGGFDLTPVYPFVEDIITWHKNAKQTCDKYGRNVYSKYKKWCDEYFFLKHRGETRGVGGLFFDDLNEWGLETTLDFLNDNADTYVNTYTKIVNKRKDIQYTQANKDFQNYRRGRYVEFNLLYDRGTAFGLQSGGRTESILMSMPPTAQWIYNWKPKSKTEEARLYKYLKPRDWLQE